MYFPENMNFQYFFFDTYPGYFLQVLPFALIACLLYGAHKYRTAPNIPAVEKVCSGLFVCYITGLVSLTIFIHIIGDIWYFLLYHGPSGYNHQWFTFNFYLIPDFFRHFDAECLGNILMYLPFGVLYPLSKSSRTWGRTLTAGFLTSLTIELIQPIFGRSFDINDIILNTLGVLVSASVFFLLRTLAHKR